MSTRPGLRLRLENAHGLTLLDGRTGHSEDLYAYSPAPVPIGCWQPLQQGGYVSLRFSEADLAQILDWWQGSLEATPPRVQRLTRLRIALGGKLDGSLEELASEEREILVQLERLQHWLAGAPNAKRARAACKRAARAFDVAYCGTALAGSLARTRGYAGLGRMERLGWALARASTEVAKLG
jgi:hypothetical protein